MKKRVIILNAILFSLATWGIIWAFISGGFLYYRYFTNQSVLLVWFSSIFYFTKYRFHKFYPYLSTISLVSIFITMTGFHILLNVPTMTLHFQLTHTIIPITYISYFYMIIEKTIPIKRLWSTLIHPLLYVCIFLIYGSISGWYPYPFLDASTQSLESILIFILLILFPIYTIISFVLIYIKNKIPHYEK